MAAVIIAAMAMADIIAPITGLITGLIIQGMAMVTVVTVAMAATATGLLAHPIIGANKGNSALLL